MPDFWGYAANLWNAEDIRDADYEIQCFTLSERSRKLCLALLDSVSYSDRYEGTVTQDEIDGWQADLAYQLMGDNAECAPEIADDNDCTLYQPDSLFIDYAPNDPFQTPDLVPDGYLFVPPWYTNPLIPLPGVLPTDAMVNFLAIGAFGDLGGLIASGLPRFQIDVDGEGEVELEFVKVPQGGNVIVVADGDPLQQQVYDLNALQLGELGTLEDLFDIVVAESLNDTTVCEVRFTTPGLHTIDVTFFPNIAADVIVGMGGGLRRVSLCGVTLTGEVSMPQFQVVDCVLQWRPNGSAAWADLLDLCAVQPPTIVRQDQTPPGNLEQDIGGSGFTEIANTDFVWRDGTHPMVGGLEIYPTADEVLLTLKGVGSPYQTQKIMRVQDSAGVDRAWINPRGDMHLSQDPIAHALTLESGGIGMERAGTITWKNSVGVYQNVLAVSSADRLYIRSPGGSTWYLSNAGYILMQINENGQTIYQNQAPGGYTQAWIVEGSGQGGTPLIRTAKSTGENLFSVQADGKLTEITYDAGTNTIPDNLLLEHRSTGTPTADFGTGIRLQGESSTTNAQNMARLYTAWETPTHATRAAKVVLSAFDYSGEKKIVEGGVTGASTPKIGFMGVTPQPALAISGDHKGNSITEQIVELLALFGLAIDNTTNVASFVISGETGGWPLLAELATALETYSPYFVDATSEGECIIDCTVPPPETYCQVYDFSDSDVRAPWVVERGVEGASGFESTLSDEVVFIHTNQFDVFHIIEVTIEYDLSGSSDGSIVMGAYDFAGYTSETWSGIPSGTGQQVTVDFSPSYDAFTGFRIVAISNDAAQQIIITGLKVLAYDQGLWAEIPAGVDCP